MEKIKALYRAVCAAGFEHRYHRTSETEPALEKARAEWGNEQTRQLSIMVAERKHALAKA